MHLILILILGLTLSPQGEGGVCSHSPHQVPSTDPQIRDPSVLSTVDRRGCAQSCLDGWNLLLGNCYKYVGAPMAWGDAEKNCLSQGGNLASMHSKTEQHSFLLDLILSKTGAKTVMWIGGYDAAQEGVWLWSDGRPMIFTDWNQGQPDNYLGSQNCMILNWPGLTGHFWDDIGCALSLPSVCKKTAEAQ